MPYRAVLAVWRVCGRFPERRCRVLRGLTLLRHVNNSWLFWGPGGLKGFVERFKMIRRIPMVVIPDLTASQDFFGHALRVFQICDLLLNEKVFGEFTSDLGHAIATILFLEDDWLS